MQTLLLYLLIMALVVAVVFAIVWFVFGRGEDLPPVERDTTLTRLPTVGICGDDVRALRFAQTPRGYKQSEVDWALARLAGEVDDLRAVIARLRSRETAAVIAEAPAGEPGVSGAGTAATSRENGVPDAGIDSPTPWETGRSVPPER
ncbi:DivIVA domain-containing protein [Gordonia jinghuaiqii]|uniref:DivIVA domain-containing protein n=1 Tax=Gordonia jinghuaiqii TaxID=2758710 RepID=UPI001CB7A143|nr:DivIVA domain-containing protein [Gordonia jinghuaiqii]